MKKTTFTIRIDTLQAINQCFVYNDVFYYNSPSLKALLNLTQKLQIKLKKKEIDKTQTKNSFRLDLEYHEIFTLHQAITRHSDIFKDQPYETAILRIFLDNINKALQQQV